MRSAILIVATLFSTAAFAQSPSTPQLVEIDDDQVEVAVLGLTVDAVEDKELFDAQGNKLGDVEEVLGPDAAHATALAIDLEGADDLDVIVGLEGLQVQDNRIVTDLTLEALSALPVWND